MRGRWKLIIACLFMVACSDDPSQPPPPDDPGPVVKETGNAVTQTVSSEGGSMIATASDGTTYTLDIPAGALAKPTAITMTPVSSIDGLEFSGGLAGAVELRPSGLVFARAAVLRIETARAPGGGERLAGFSGNGDLSARALSFTASDGGGFQVVVQHFSVVGAGFGTNQDISQIPTITSNALQAATNQLVAFAQPWDAASIAAATQIGHDVLTQVVLLHLQSAANDLDLLDAVAEYSAWRFLLDTIDNGGDLPIQPLFPNPVVHRTPAGFTDNIHDAGEAAADALVLAIGGNNSVCGQQASLEALANVFFWQSQASQFGVADAAHGLDVPTVLNGICATVVLISSTLPGQMQVGFPNSVDLNLALEFTNGTRVPTNFKVDLTGTGISIQSPTGLTGNSQSGIGRYTSVVTATSTGALELRAHACLMLPGNVTTASPLCGDFVLAGNGSGTTGVDLTGTWTLKIVGFGDTTHCLGFGGLGPNSFGTVTIAQNQNAFSGSWTYQNGFCGANISSASGTMSGTVAFNPQTNQAEVLNWSIQIGFVSNPQVCVAFIPEIEVLSPAPVSLSGNGFGSTDAIGSPTLEGCPSTISFSVTMGR